MKAELFIAARQLWHRRLLNSIAVLGVTLGVLALIAITGIMRGFQTKFLDTILATSPHVVMFDRALGENRPVVDMLLGGASATHVSRQSSTERQQQIVRPRETVAAIRSLVGVNAVAALVVGNAMASVGSKEVAIEIRGIDPVIQDVVTPLSGWIIRGRLNDLNAAGDSVMIGKQLADLLGVGIGDSFLCASARGVRVSTRVAVIFESGIAALDKSRIYVVTRLAQTILGRGDAIDRIEIRLANPDNAPSVTSRLESLFGYDAESWQATNASMLSVFDQQNLITGFMIGAVLLVGGFGILSIQIMIVLEKRRDIALLKSVGYSARSVLTIFLFQGAVVAVVGAIVGSGLGHFLLMWMRTIRTAAGMGLSKPSTFAIYERTSVYMFAFGFAVTVGVLASLVPAWRASKVEPVDVLRGT
jgi:lipoprotein-releasing system permease protein